MGTLGAALATPLFTFILLFLLKKFIHTKYTIYIFFKYSYNQNWGYEQIWQLLQVVEYTIKYAQQLLNSSYVTGVDEFPMPVIGNLFMKQGLLQFLCTYIFIMRQVVDVKLTKGTGRYVAYIKIQFRLYMPLNPQSSKAHQVSYEIEFT